MVTRGSGKLAAADHGPALGGRDILSKRNLDHHERRMSGIFNFQFSNNFAANSYKFRPHKSLVISIHLTPILLFAEDVQKFSLLTLTVTSDNNKSSSFFY